MTPLLALFSRLKPLLPALAAHWRAVAVVALASFAVLAYRGCAAERLRANGATAQAQEANARLKAEFEGALASVRGLSAELGKRIDAKPGAEPVAVFSGSSSRQVVPAQHPLPVAPASANALPAASAGEPPPCVLSVGEGYEFHLSGVELKAKDGGHSILADVSIEADGGLHLSAVVEAPVTLPPVDLTPAPDAVRTPGGLGFGATGALGLQGWAVGPAVALPPLRFLGFEASTTLGATFGPGGSQGLATVTVRR